MDFDDTPEEAAFRAEARAFLTAHAKLRNNDDRSHHLPDPTPESDAEHVLQCKVWQRTLFDNGWAGITWPREYGGRGGTPTQQSIFDQEQAAFDVSNGAFAVGIGMAGPTLMVHGTDAQKDRYLEPLLKGDEVWCQLFSEPGAGSDLAGLGTRAVRDGDEWVVNGQKVWTTGAQHSDVAILLARTDPTVPKHAGISYFVLDMTTPGVDVRPLHQITGIAEFNEVFLTDVRIPADNLVGSEGDGWRVARTTLANERGLIGGGNGRPGGFSDVLDLARQLGRQDDPLVRQGLAELYTRTEVLRYLGLRVRSAVSQGRQPGPESSVLKLAYSLHLARSNDFTVGLIGAGGMLSGSSAIDNGFWQYLFLNQWASRIGGGTDQIQRNVIGERVLGLPGEPRTDRDAAFRDLAKG